MDFSNGFIRLLIIQRYTDLFAGHVEFVFIGIVLVDVAGEGAEGLLGDEGEILSHFEGSFLK